MSGQDLTDFRLEKLEKSDEKKTEILSEFGKQLAIMQTKFLVIGIFASSTVSIIATLIVNFIDK